MYENPVNVIKSQDFKSDINGLVLKYNLSSPLIISSEGMIDRLELYKNINHKYIYSYVKPNPTIDDCQKLIGWLNDLSIDCIIAIGGGSVMDSAKIAKASIVNKVNDINKLFNLNKYNEKTLTSIHIPTTHGTGSEVTIWSTVWDDKNKSKYSVSNYTLYPDYAILDHNLVTSLPIDTSIITTLDALSHSFESIWNKNRNEKSNHYAIEAISLIINNYEKVKKGTGNLQARKNLLKASNLAGLAFSNTKTAAAHSISYPLTQYFNIPHGIAASMPLTALIDINYNQITREINIILENSKLSNVEELKNKIIDIPKGLIKYSLKEYGIRKEDIINIIIPNSNTPDRMKNNIVNLDDKNIKYILKSIY